MEWISVDTEMPIKDGTFFVAINANNRPAFPLVTWFSPLRSTWKYTGGEFIGYEFKPHFTHWMPLPAPPTK